MSSSKSYLTSRIFRQLFVATVVSTVLFTLVCYGLLQWQHRISVRAHHIAQVETLVRLAANALNKNTHITQAEVKALYEHDDAYQIILFEPARQPMVVEQIPGALKKKRAIDFGLPDFNAKIANQTRFESGYLTTWRKLPYDHHLYAKFVIKQPYFWQGSLQNWLWLAALSLPFFLSLLLAVLLVRRFSKGYGDWLSIVSYTSNIDSRRHYQPLALSESSTDEKEFASFKNLINRIAYHFYRQQQTIDTLAGLRTQLIINSPEAVFRLNPNGYFDFINTEFARAFNLDAAQAEQLKLNDLTLCINQSDQPLINELATNPQQLRLEVKHKLLEKYYQLWLNPVYDATNILTGFSGVLHDITQKQKSLKNLKNEQRRIDKRIRANEKLWAVMGHELRTPLNGMIGTITLLDDTTLSDEQDEYLSILKTSSDAMLHLLNDMLDLSKMDAGKMQTVTSDIDLLELCREVCNLMYGNTLKKELELIFFAEPNAPRFVPGDAQRIRQVLLNLIGNAIKFTETGHISLLVETVDSANPDIVQRHIPSKEGTRWLCFKIEDTGPGISDEEQQKLFMFFNQANASVSRRFGGTGLGLAISKGLSEMMGGFITLSSTLGKGTTFKLYLPFEVDNDSKMYNYPALTQDVYLMIFESNPVNRDHLSSLLSEIGLPVIMFDALSAEHLSIMSSSHHSSLTPILIIDHKLLIDVPGLVDELLENRAFLMRNKLLMSSRSQRSVASNLMSVFDGFISKPIFVENFLAEVLRVSSSQKLFEETQGQQLNDDLFSSMLEDIQLSQEKILTSMQNDDEVGTTDRSTHVKENNINTSTTADSDADDGKTKVILAEDNLVNQKVAKKMLEKQGFSVIIAENGLEAIDKLQDNKDVKLIFMDCRMPKMDGLTATRKIRELKNSVPIIALTANDTEEDRRDCEMAGMDEFLAKPINKAKLNEMISRYKPLF